ncbi:MAG TPA: TetR/AcrR family transcriptional regulator [Noviherbaspirillum sp.]|uniref:TetR/AcrR family transcriptional regulator n=1 Tax=Noviherbaspirillum sp. TaxID=1926288 RepID=UPI002B467FA6|nr:TetR/AcrR family transcriptional regulator [Noviherbaspirillum sp.]HJV88179.1 TetR/AcrR family transcriptional regulator [Noviherbaspirillum sp.]
MTAQRAATVPATARSKRAEPAPIPRDRILHAAARLFRERGYKGTTVRDIADAVGILSGSLFYHFRSKEEMLLDIMREAAMTLCIRAEEVLKRTASPSERLEQFIDIELEWMVGEIKKDYLAVLVFEWREVPEAAKPELTRLHKRYHTLWANVLEEYGQAVPMRIPADAAARILHGALMGAMTWFRSSGRYSAQEFRDMLIRIVQA